MNCIRIIGILGGLVLSALLVFVIGFAVVWGILPFVFYGKVLDTDGKPVAGADVKISIAVFPYSNGGNSSRYTDEKGIFSVWGIGAGLNATASAAGYYSTDQSLGVFGRLDGELSAHMTSANAAVLKLRKMGISEPLIHISKDVSSDAKWTPIPVDLASGRTYRLDRPDVTVQIWAPAEADAINAKRYDWKCMILVPGGGIQPRKGGEFDFVAPESGYQPAAVIEMSSANPRWNSSYEGDYFLKLENGRFARIGFTVAPGDRNPGFQIDSYLNPNPGHRNLEFDQAKQIKPTPIY